MHGARIGYNGSMSIYMNTYLVVRGVFAARAYAPNAMRQGVINAITQCVIKSSLMAKFSH